MARKFRSTSATSNKNPMAQIESYPPRSPDERERFLNVIHESLSVQRHFDLFVWLQGDLQLFLPHDILLAAWGDFAQGLIFIDVVSPLPGIRTESVIDRNVRPFVLRLFQSWRDAGCGTFLVSVPDGVALGGEAEACSVSTGFGIMRSAIVHGIKDERGQHDCLYVVLGREDAIRPSSRKYMEVLLPHIDMALRQVIHLPVQRREEPLPVADDPEVNHGLSCRELEIMEWVRLGKTNQEIGLILDISAFTVKNHLQRIFRKLDVANRAQAVSWFAQLKGRVGA